MNSISGTESRQVIVIRLSAIYRMDHGVEKLCPKHLLRNNQIPSINRMQGWEKEKMLDGL